MKTSLRYLSPFRYPGGKTWLAPHIRRWLTSKKSKPKEFIEPFAGGASVGLLVAAESLAEHVTLVERDEQVAAVWNTIIYGDWRWLAERIGSFDFTPRNVQAVLAQYPKNAEELAFQTILRNRIRRGGILAPGAGTLNRGENDHGWCSRWYPETLKSRIRSIVQLRKRITFISGNGISYIERLGHCSNAVFFVDPPYTADERSIGSRLYTYHLINHEKLFDLVSVVTGDFLMTYNDSPTVVALAEGHALEVCKVSMRNTNSHPLQELLIGRDLGWVPNH